MQSYSPTRPAQIDADIWEMTTEVNISAISDILHARGNHQHVMSHEIQALALGTRLRGIARTMASSLLVGLPEAGREYEKLFAAIDGLGGGDVLVTDSMDCCVWGELCSEAVMRRGGNGTVIDGFTRDSADIVRIGFPLFCRGRHMSDMLYHRQITELDRPIVCGGVTVHRGDLILGGDDGVLAVPAALINAVVAEANAKCNTESEVRVALRNGMSATDAYRRFGVM